MNGTVKKVLSFIKENDITGSDLLSSSSSTALIAPQWRPKNGRAVRFYLGAK
jgi:hypothetical protein